MKAAVFNTRQYDRASLTEANSAGLHDLVFFDLSLNEHTAALARGFPAVCPFVNDRLNAAVLGTLRDGGTRVLALRSAGFNHVDVHAAARLGISVLRVPAYSPHAVAEHTIALILTLNRKTHRAYNRVREQNFSLDGLMGFDLVDKTAGVVGTGKIGAIVAGILRGFGCRVLAYDPRPDPECEARGVVYAPLEELLRQSDVLTLHCPLSPATRHLIDEAALRKIKRGMMLVNTSRGAVVDSQAVIAALKSGALGSLALDVYEEESDLFFRDLSSQVIADDVFVRLMTFPNVLITAHQAFFTREAVRAIAETTIQNLSDYERGVERPENRVTEAMVVA
ncbi:MAG: 2-hydroxyacid dehydrogenase [Planctomycetota bacterium]|nr:2-hydroxyacid dehydrogenase [Planctomycetota bacterium]